MVLYYLLPAPPTMAIINTDDLIGEKHLTKFPKYLNPANYLYRLKGFLGFVPLSVGVTVLTFYYWVSSLIKKHPLERYK